MPAGAYSSMSWVGERGSLKESYKLSFRSSGLKYFAGPTCSNGIVCQKVAPKSQAQRSVSASSRERKPNRPKPPPEGAAGARRIWAIVCPERLKPNVNILTLPR